MKIFIQLVIEYKLNFILNTTILYSYRKQIINNRNNNILNFINKEIKNLKLQIKKL